MASYGQPPPQPGPYPSPYPMSSFTHMPGPPPAPYYLPPYYPTPPLSHGPPMRVVDQKISMVPFKFRPRAYKISIVLLIIGVSICLGWVALVISNISSFGIYSIIPILFIAIGTLGIVSIILMFIPKKIGWYFAFVTGCLALAGLGVGTIIGMYLMICLMWPSVRYYFHTGEYPPHAPVSRGAGFQGQQYTIGDQPTRFRD